MKKGAGLVIAVCIWLTGLGQGTFPVNGVFDVRSEQFAFTNATIVVDPENIIDSGTLLIRKGIIMEVDHCQ